MNNDTGQEPNVKNRTQKGNKGKGKGKGRKSKKNGMLIIIAIFLGFIFLNRSDPVETIDCNPDIIATKPDIIMLGAWWCNYCYQAKKYFQRNNIHYCEYDMESTETGKRLYLEHGGGAIPLLLIGQHQLTGFDEQRIEYALNLLKKAPGSDEKSLH